MVVASGRAWRTDGAEPSGDDAMKSPEFSVDPKQMGGVPCIRGLRVQVSTVVAMLADGMSEMEILAAYPDLERDDIFEALQYAAEKPGRRAGALRHNEVGK
jgi:uncharacterized protein (DUF433 family)